MSGPMTESREALAEAWRGWTRLLATGKAPTTRLLARDAFAAGWDAAIEAAARSEGPGLDALREALIRYGARHLSDCRASNPADPCTCGLNALLTEGGSR